MAQEASTADHNDGYPIKIFIYDLSQGMASQFSQQLIGKQVDGIWHTSIIVYEKEYFYGGGIQSDNPGRTPYGTPLRRIEMGQTYKTQSEFHAFLQEAAPRFSPSKYDLFKHNCNTFADHAMKFLNDRNIPEYITGLPEEFLRSEVGQMLKPMIDNMQQTAMAQYGDWGAVGVANKPHLPPLNPKYNKQIKAPQSSQPKQAAKASEEINVNGLEAILSTYCDKHKHKKLELKSIQNELKRKITNDDKNGALYVAMIEKYGSDNETMSEGHKEALNSFAAYLKDKQQKHINDNTLEILDELLLMTECQQLFPLVSLLRLLLINPVICKRYGSDFMIINQILYKIGIPFEELTDANQEEKENNEEIEMNLMDIGLLQFTSIAAVSHLYLGCDIKIDDCFVNLALNALNVNNCNVGLSAARLLFNMVCVIKSVAILKKQTEVNAALKKIMNGICRYLQNKTVTHIPTLYRLLSIIGVVLYCNNYDDSSMNELLLNKKEIDTVINNINKNIQPPNDAIRDLQSDIALLF